MDNPQPNAFATGRNPQNAAVASHHRAPHPLSREEAAGVIAHELAHVRNRDTLIMTLTATIAGAISMLGNFAMFFGGGRNREGGGLGPVATIAMIILAPIAAMIVQMAISRTREYAADRGGAEISGEPLWLASALQRIDAAAHQIENQTAEENPASAPLFIINPLSGARMDNLFSTHPATENRIEALMTLAQQMGKTAAGPAGRGTVRCRPNGRRGAARAVGRRGLSAADPGAEMANARRRAGRDANPPGLAARRDAVRGLAAVLREHRPLDLAFPAQAGVDAAMASRDRALTRAIVATTLRRMGQIERVLGQFIERPLPAKSGQAREILLTAAAQLLFLRTPAHAVIDLAVRLTGEEPGSRHLGGLVNAVLRKVAAGGARLLDENPAPLLNTPAWLMERWAAAFGVEMAHAIAASHLVEPPLDLTAREPAQVAAELGGLLLPGGTVRLEAARGRIEDLPGSARAMVGPGRGGGHCRFGCWARSRGCGSSISAPRRAARRRSWRRRRPWSPRSNARRSASSASPPTSRGSLWRPRRSVPMPVNGGRRRCSTRCCSTPPARQPAPSGATPMCPVSRRRP